MKPCIKQIKEKRSGKLYLAVLLSLIVMMATIPLQSGNAHNGNDIHHTKHHDGKKYSRRNSLKFPSYMSYLDKRQKNLEERLQRKIISQLAPLLGKKNISVQITANLNLKRIVKNQEILDPNSRLEQIIHHIENKNQKNIIVSNDERIEYLTGRTNKLTVQNPGSIRNLNLSILINERLIQENGRSYYLARSEEEIQNYAEIIKAAIGYNEQRGDILKISTAYFNYQKNPDERGANYNYSNLLPALIIIYLILLILVIIISIFVYKKGKILLQKIKPPFTKNNHKYNDNVKSQLDCIAKQNPDETLTLIREWIQNQDDDSEENS